MTPDKLPEDNRPLPADVVKEIKRESFLSFPDKDQGPFRIGYQDGATAWAPWKVRYDELQDRSEKLRLALVMAVFALKQSYDVTEHPADGNTNQDSAIRIGEEALQQFKDGKEVAHKIYRPCPHCGKELFRDRNLCCRACGKEVGDEV